MQSSSDSVHVGVQPSTTFLFDQQRTGRAPYALRSDDAPNELWRTWLPSFPPRGAESSPAFDREGNLYFGSHDGCFYSLTPEGRVRWMFKTDAKIYSSPQLLDDSVAFCGGDGYLYLFDFHGQMRWNYDLGAGAKGKGTSGKIKKFVKELPVTLDWKRKYLVTTKSWASPCLHPNGFLVATGYGRGIHAVNLDGTRRWLHDFGQGQYSLAGVCLDSNGNIYGGPLEGKVMSLDASGKVNFELATPKRMRNWAAPSFDEARGRAYYPLSDWEKSGLVVAVSARGERLWSTDIPGGIRGSVVIPAEGPHVITCSLNGRLLWLNADTGKVEREVRLSKDSRALWTTPSIDPHGRLLITVKDTYDSGRLVAVNLAGEQLWSVDVGKALNTPVIDQHGRIYVGSWDGTYRCLQS